MNECAATEFKIDANDVTGMSRKTATNPKLLVNPSSPLRPHLTRLSLAYLDERRTGSSKKLGARFRQKDKALRYVCEMSAILLVDRRVYGHSLLASSCRFGLGVLGMLQEYMHAVSK